MRLRWMCRLERGGTSRRYPLAIGSGVGLFEFFPETSGMPGKRKPFMVGTSTG